MRRNVIGYTEIGLPQDETVALLYAVSYEKRALKSLQRTLGKFKMSRVILILFNVEDYLTDDVLAVWKQQKRLVESILKKEKIGLVEIKASDREFGDVIKQIHQHITGIDLVLVDLTTLPKNYILKICQSLEGTKVLFQYTRGEPYVKLNEDERKVGIARIVPVDGFEGRIKINAEDLLVLILGFESNRALPFLDEFPTAKTIALLGAPRAGLSSITSDDMEYLVKVREANHQLLNNSFVNAYEVNSLDPYLFSNQLGEIVQANKSRDSNIIVVPVGTKPQTLGLYLYWKSTPQIQILYPVPSKRLKIASRTGDTFFYTL
jgi:hypothetical protein